ncbi:MAG: flagellar basal body rod protein FlgB [Chromatiales bacterium]|jgi:flagellar basal-body rod protein FlgB
MPLSIDAHLGIHADALAVRSRRTELLASNIANADTPNYKARDVDFRAALEQARGAQSGGLRTTHANHISTAAFGGAMEVGYRVPFQPSLDGNTVDPQQEKAAFAENTVRYQTTLTFLNSKINSLRGALRGE